MKKRLGMFLLAAALACGCPAAGFAGAVPGCITVQAEEAADAGVVRTGWQKENGKTYYLDAQGEKVTGWQVIEGKRYYFLKFGAHRGEMATGWKTIDGEKYYFLKSGRSAGGMATGWQTIGGKKYYFLMNGKSAGRMATGWKTIDGRKYYFLANGRSKGQMVTGWKTIGNKRYYFTPSGSTAGQAATGWKIMGKTCYYFSKSGVLNTQKTVSASRSGDSTGSAATKTLRRAKAIAAQITTDSMTKEQKLRVCFEYVMKYPGRRPRTPHYYGTDWPVVYANDMFLDGSGNCFSYAAAFAYLAKACGYTNVYVCNDTGHGWTEINGRIYDPEEYRNTKYKYYGTSYDQVPVYKRAISEGREFMHVKI